MKKPAFDRRALRFHRPRNWLRISLLSALPAWVVLLLLLFGGAVSFRPAVAAALLAGILGGLVAWRPARLRDALRRRIDALAAGDPDPGRPVASDGLNRAFERFVRVWRKRIDRLTQESSERPRIMDVIPDPVLLIDHDRQITRANRAARELVGIELAGHDLAVVLRQPELIEAADRILAGEPGQSIELAFRVPVERNFAVRVEPLGEDVPDAAVIAFHDLTPLEQTERMRADFVANVSHELRTPLAGLIGYIETLRGPARDDPEARDKFLATMQELADRMSRLVSDLLSLTRIEMEEHARPTEPVDIAQVMKSVATSLAQRAERRSVTISQDIPDGLPAVTGDADQLAEVFENLLDNAFKYGREGGVVTLGAEHRPDAETLTVWVQDDGPGIPAQHIPRLTERFYRVDPDRSRSTGGTGLGLAIVKHIVNRHRGRLSVTSRPGEGSRFAVTLPVAPAGAGAASRRAATR